MSSLCPNAKGFRGKSEREPAAAAEEVIRRGGGQMGGKEFGGSLSLTVQAQSSSYTLA